MTIPIPVVVGGLVVFATLAITVASLARAVLRLRIRNRGLERDTSRLYRDHGRVSEELEQLQIEASGLSYVLHDSHRRWGWPLDRFPLHAALIRWRDGEIGSRWLLEHAPGNWSYLHEGGEPTDRLAIRPFNGWRPPASLNGKGHPTRRVRRSAPQGS